LASLFQRRRRRLRCCPGTSGPTENEALEPTLQNSAPHLKPPPPATLNLWAALTAPPPLPPPAAHAYVPSIGNWPWEMSEFVVINVEDQE
jgi:hypothetical protein